MDRSQGMRASPAMRLGDTTGLARHAETPLDMCTVTSPHAGALPLRTPLWKPNPQHACFPTTWDIFPPRPQAGCSTAGASRQAQAAKPSHVREEMYKNIYVCTHLCSAGFRLRCTSSCSACVWVPGWLPVSPAVPR